jgi:type II secretory pathway component PulF
MPAITQALFAFNKFYKKILFLNLNFGIKLLFTLVLLIQNMNRIFRPNILRIYSFMRIFEIYSKDIALEKLFFY